MWKDPKFKPWIVGDSEYVLENPWIAVREEDCRTENDEQLGHYYVLEYPEWVHMVVLDENDRVLVTRQYRHGRRIINYEIPSGCMWPQDKTVQDAAQRELKEETGYVGDFKQVASLSPNPATHNNLVHTFLVTNPKQEVKPEDNVYEAMDFHFVPLPELMELIDEGKFQQSLHIAGLFFALRERGLLSISIHS